MINIIKNTESAKYFGSTYGQDVEPTGTYVIEKDNDSITKHPWIEGKADIKNPLEIIVNEDTLISYKYDLAKKFKRKGKKLTEKLMTIGYDAIITKYENGDSGEIILFPNCNFMLGINENKKKIKSLLREDFSSEPYEILETLMVEDYPNSFDMEYFKTLVKFTERVKYCEENLKRISSGSARIVYMIDNEKVLKLAKNKKGLAQNETEIQWGNDGYFGSILAKTFNYDDNNLWVEMELAKKVNKNVFLTLAECKIDDMYNYLDNFYNVANGGRKLHSQSPEIIEMLNENHFVYSIREFMMNIDVRPGDFGRLNSYGLVQRNGQDDIVLIDFGLTNAIYDTYYS
jgi:hypothetical protein